MPCRLVKLSIERRMLARRSNEALSLSLTYGNPHGSPDERENGARQRSERRYRQGDRIRAGSRTCRCRDKLQPDGQRDVAKPRNAAFERLSTSPGGSAIGCRPVASLLS